MTNTYNKYLPYTQRFVQPVDGFTSSNLGFRLFAQDNVSLPNNTFNGIDLSTATTNIGLLGSINVLNFIFPDNGAYSINLDVKMNLGGSIIGKSQIQLLVASAPCSWVFERDNNSSGAGAGELHLSGVRNVSAGDQFSCYVYQTTGLDITYNYRLDIVKITHLI